jgi:hypothetical protein
MLAESHRRSDLTPILLSLRGSCYRLSGGVTLSLPWCPSSE